MRFIAKLLWKIPDEDLALIIKDWNKIVDKVKAGKAHEISEGDTLYLGACTKAANSSIRTTQPFSEIPAKPRAFSFKPSYMKLVYNQIKHREGYDEFLKAPPTRPFEDLVLDSLRQHEGRLVEDLFKEFGPDINQNSKNKYALLTNRLLGIKSKKISEFEKAGIIIRTLRLRKNGNPKEDISFPAFDYFKIIEQEWDESDFKDIVESKFFFVLLQETKEGLIFQGARFWNMPYEDRLEAERVFNETVYRINNKKSDQLPSKKFSQVSHVRPHGRNKKDTLVAPGGITVVKQCFWLNSPYIGPQLKKS